MERVTYALHSKYTSIGSRHCCLVGIAIVRRIEYGFQIGGGTGAVSISWAHAGSPKYGHIDREDCSGGFRGAPRRMFRCLT